MMKESMRLRGEIFLLCFSSFGGMGPSAIVVYKRIATLIAEKRGHPYTAMCCIGLDVVSVFHCSVLLSCICGDQDLVITGII